MHRPIPSYVHTSALIAVLVVLCSALSGQKSARVRAKIVDERIVVRCQIASDSATLPAYLFLSYDRLCGVELHNQAANALEIEKNGRRKPFTVAFPGLEIPVDAREHGDEDALNDFTKLYASELEEIGVLGTIGANLLKDYHIIFDLDQGLIEIAEPKALSEERPTGPEATYVKAYATTKLVWLPITVRGEHKRVVGIGGEQYDSIIDELLCEEFEAMGGNIGSVEVGGFDLSKIVPWRPEELPFGHEDGALGVLGINFLKDFRVDIDRVNGWVGLTRRKVSRFPLEERAFFEARATEEVEPVHTWFESHSETRLAETAAELLLFLHIDSGSKLEDIVASIAWLDATRHPAFRSTKGIETMQLLMMSRLPEAAVAAGKLAAKGGRADRYPESVHRLHVRLGQILLDLNRDREAWEHLLSAAFGLNEAVGAADQAKVNLLLGKYYERKKRYKRALSRYVQAVITPEAGEAAIAGLTRVQEKAGGEAFSYELVDRLISGKVRNMTAPTKFVADEKTSTNRTILVEHVTNPHLGRKQGENWRAFTEGGSMVFQGLMTHFPRDRVVMLGYHMGTPRPVGITNELAVEAAARSRNRPAFFIDGKAVMGGALEYHKADAGYSRMKSSVLARLAIPSSYSISGDVHLRNGRVIGSVSVKGPRTDSLVELILAEKGVLYPGIGATVVHRMVARASLSGAVDGVAFEPTDGSMNLKFDRSLAEIEAQNRAFLEEYEEKVKSIATRLSLGMDPSQLVVIVFLRDEVTKEIEQAAQFDVVGGAE